MSMDQLAYAEHQEAVNNEEAKNVASCSERKLAVQEKIVHRQMTQVEIAKEMLKRQIEESEERVMSIDTEKMAPWVREYYIHKQKQISQKTLADDSSSGPSGI
jgi:hypothetical protein